MLTNVVNSIDLLELHFPEDGLLQGLRKSIVYLPRCFLLKCHMNEVLNWGVNRYHCERAHLACQCLPESQAGSAAITGSEAFLNRVSGFSSVI